MRSPALSSTYRPSSVPMVLALVAVGVAGAALIAGYLTTLWGASRVERGSACMALGPEVLAGPAEAFSLPDLEGQRRSLAAQRGKVVLLNFWATWCPPCVEELPSMVQLQRTLDPQRFAMLTVSVDETAQVVQQFIARHRALIGGLPVLMDPSKRVPSAYGTEKFPETYLIDAAGNLRYRFINKRDWSSPAAQACIQSLM